MKTHLLFLSFLTVHCVTYQIKEITPVQKEGIPFETKKETGSEENTLPPGVLVIPNKKNTPPVKTPIPLNTQEGISAKPKLPVTIPEQLFFPRKKFPLDLKAGSFLRKYQEFLRERQTETSNTVRKTASKKTFIRLLFRLALFPPLPAPALSHSQKRSMPFKKPLPHRKTLKT